MALIHSERTEICLCALQAWITEGQPKSFSERVTSVNIRFVAVYQLLWIIGPEGNEDYRYDLENKINRTPKSINLIIGGDHNSHIGRDHGYQETSGRHGLRTPTTEQGADFLNWCATNGLQWVNMRYMV